MSALTAYHGSEKETSAITAYHGSEKETSAITAYHGSEKETLMKTKMVMDRVAHITS